MLRIQKKYLYLHTLLGRIVNELFILTLMFYCENSSVGRAQPCQGWGREFESRFSLNKFLSRSSGGIGRHAGLKILWALARAGSSPASSTCDPHNLLIVRVFLFD